MFQMVRTRRQKARVNSAPPQLEPMDIPSNSFGNLDDFRVVRSATGEVTLSPHPVSMVLPSPSSKRTAGTMVEFLEVEFLEVDKPLVGSSNVRVGAPLVTAIGASRRRRVIITVESNEEEDSQVRQPQGEMEAEEEELDPLWAKAERSFFVAERGDDEDEPDERLGRDEAPENAGSDRGQSEEIRLGSEDLEWGIDTIRSIVTDKFGQPKESLPNSRQCNP